MHNTEEGRSSACPHLITKEFRFNSAFVRFYAQLYWSNLILIHAFIILSLISAPSVFSRKSLCIKAVKWFEIQTSVFRVFC
jgi:hypothetical protein